MSATSRTLRISVIIPALNEADTITGLLDDLAPLRLQGHEIILVDGGSEDRTAEAAAPKVDHVLHSIRGRAAQMNAGAERANGDILWFLHADTRIPPAAAERLLQACRNGQLWGWFDISLSGSNWLLRIVERLMNLRSHATGLATGDQGIFVERGTFDAVSGFPQIPLMEDIAMSKALRRRSPPARIRRPRLQTSSRRWENRGIVRTIVLMWRLRLAYALGAEPQDLAKRYR
jgi:rSAM/selenodomain-associated transferase 2